MPGILEVSWFLDWAIKLGIGHSTAVDTAAKALGEALIETRIYLLERSGITVGDYGDSALIW